MPFPSTSFPTALDAVEDRTDYADVVYADDFDYHDKQIRKVQEYFGISSELIGQRIAGKGPGGMVSPIASGAAVRAFRLAARNAFSEGYLLSVGDAWDTSYTEKLQLSYEGLLWTLSGIDASAKLKIPRSALPLAGEEGRLHWDPAGPSLKYDDGAAWNDVGSGIIEVQEEGVTVEAALVTLNFTGDGVTASSTAPGVVQVSVPGGGLTEEAWALLDMSFGG